MPRISEFMLDVSNAIAAIPTSSRPAETFLEHKGHTGFRESPAAGRDGFAVSLDQQPVTLEGFGIAGQKNLEVFLVVELGHSPSAANNERERALAEDVERVIDVLEGKVDWIQGAGGVVDLVRCDSRGRTDRGNANWWITPLIFKCLIWSPIWEP